MTEAPHRAHEFACKVGADTKKDLAWRLRAMADDIERDQLTAGVSGSPSVGAIYAYRVDGGMTHDSYFEQLDRYLDELKAAPGLNP